VKKCVIVAIARDENRYVCEWVKHHIDLGFDEIRVYDNCSEIPLQTEIDKLPDEYRSRVFVEIEPVSENPQFMSYQKGLEYYRDSAEWIAYIDLDEFFTLEKPLAEILDRRANVGALFVCWKNYNANGHETYEGMPVAERFTEVCPEIRDPSKGKSIVRPQAVLCAGVHYPILKPGASMTKTDGTECYHAAVSPVYKDMYIKHYYTKSYEEWLWKMNRGSCDSRALREYDEFFWYNPDLQHLYDPELAGLRMGYAHQPPEGGPEELAPEDEE